MHRCSKLFMGALLLLPMTVSAQTQSCRTMDEIPGEAVLTLKNSAQRVFAQAATGDVDAIKANAIPSLQANFTMIAGAVHDNHAVLVDGHLQLRTIFLLETGANPRPDGLFLCGIFGANGPEGDAAEFGIPGIPLGRFGIVIEDIVRSQDRYAFTAIFQDTNGWKLAGLYIRPELAQGHDGMWYVAQARQFKRKGERLNAWFYYVESWELLAPVTFMENELLSEITAESKSVQPADVPVGGASISFSAGERTYEISEITVVAGKQFDLVIKYSIPGSANGNSTPEPKQLADAYVAKHPEVKDAFDGLFVVAVDPNGREIATAGIKLNQ